MVTPSVITMLMTSSAAKQGRGWGGREGVRGGRGKGRDEENQGLLMTAVKHSSDGELLYHVTHIRRPKRHNHKNRERGLSTCPMYKCSLKNVQTLVTFPSLGRTVPDIFPLEPGTGRHNYKFLA